MQNKTTATQPTTHVTHRLCSTHSTLVRLHTQTVCEWRAQNGALDKQVAGILSEALYPPLGEDLRDVPPE